MPRPKRFICYFLRAGGGANCASFLSLGREGAVAITRERERERLRWRQRERKIDR